MEKQIKWESYENMKERVDAERAKKNELHKEEIMRQLNDPNISDEQKSALMEQLYKDISIK